MVRVGGVSMFLFDRVYTQTRNTVVKAVARSGGSSGFGHLMETMDWVRVCNLAEPGLFVDASMYGVTE